MTTPHFSDPEPPRSHNQTLGALGEELAAGYLVGLGYRLLAQNWRCKYGELDLVMQDGSTVVAVEVKTRSGSGYGSPLEAITARKASRLWRLLLEWRRAHHQRDVQLRVDAVGITFERGGSTPHIDHLRAIS